MTSLLLALAVAVSPTVTVPPTTGPATPATAIDPTWDAAYTAAIRAETTDPQFLTDLVDHLPASVGVPSPLSFFGHIVGAAGHVTYAKDVHAYMRALAAATPRVKVFTIGNTEEGREMIAVAVAAEATMAALDRYKAITRALSDPRRLGDSDVSKLLDEGKPIYYLTGAMHSPETGSPEMLMELAYRLAVDESPAIKSVRENVITLITPVLEVDGRERMVDLIRDHQAHPDTPMTPLVYWGHYVGHDNNRDSIGLALRLTRNVLATFLEWRPQVIHDLHESIPFLYISSGTGPYNAWLDPLMVDEWERQANHEVAELTRRGLPGVWTHGFYDGWAPNYMFWIGMGRNAVGRFYETFGNSLPDTEDRVVRRMSDRAWFRPNPPLPRVRWSLRNNVNYQESGVLLALADAAAHRRQMLSQYLQLARRSVAKARTEGPAAYVFPADQPRKGLLRDLLLLLGDHGIEVHVAETAFALKPGWPPAGTSAPKSGDKPLPAEQEIHFPAGSFVVRLDQPFSRLADALLDTQFVRGDERVYDDTGWTLPYAFDVDCRRIVNPDVLGVPMRSWDGLLIGSVVEPGAAALAVANHADVDLIRLRAALPLQKILVAEAQFKAGRTWPTGTVLVPLAGADLQRVAEAIGSASLDIAPLAAMPAVAVHELGMPRIAILHTWQDTQDEGWYRLALDKLGVPYAYISTQQVAGDAELGKRFDVIIFPPTDLTTQEIVNGLPPGPPQPWRTTALTPNLSVDQTDDVRPGLGHAGVANLARFVEAGGLLITAQETARWAAETGLARWVKVAKTAKLKARGSLLRANIVDQASPIAYGFDGTVPVHFAGDIVLQVGAFEPRERDRDATRPSGRGSATDPDVPQGRPFVPVPQRATPAPGEEGFVLPEEYPSWASYLLPRPADRPRVIAAFPKESDTILLSGMLEGGEDLAGKPVVIDAPRGRGHIVLFVNDPMRRTTTRGTWALVFNAVFNHEYLGAGRPPSPR